MTEPVFNPESNRVKMAELLFEKYGFARMQIGIQALLSLFAEVIYKIEFKKMESFLIIGLDDKCFIGFRRWCYTLHSCCRR